MFVAADSRAKGKDMHKPQGLQPIKISSGLKVENYRERFVKENKAKALAVNLDPQDQKCIRHRILHFRFFIIIHVKKQGLHTGDHYLPYSAVHFFL